MAGRPDGYRRSLKPAWDGRPLPRGTIVLWAEQGLGDTVQFVRYAALVKERVGTVLVDCPGPLRGAGDVSGGRWRGRRWWAGADARCAGAADERAAHPGDYPRSSIPGTDLLPVRGWDLAERWTEKLGTRQGPEGRRLLAATPSTPATATRLIPLKLFRPLAECPACSCSACRKATGRAS